MHAHRPATVVTCVVAAWLAAACQSSPLRPTPQPPPSAVPPLPELIVVSGVVFEAPADPDGAPVPISGADVSVMAGSSATPLLAVTDSSGWFELAPSKGTVTITVTKDGYETLVTSMELADNTSLNLEMKRVTPAATMIRR